MVWLIVIVLGRYAALQTILLPHDATLVQYVLRRVYSICLSASPSQAVTVPKWLNAGSRNQRRTIARGL